MRKSVDTLSDSVLSCQHSEKPADARKMKNRQTRNFVERKRTVTRTISIEPHLLSEVKARAAANGQTVSSFIRVLLNREFAS